MLRSLLPTLPFLFVSIAAAALSGCNSPAQEAPEAAPAEQLEYTTIKGRLTHVSVRPDGSADIEISPSARRYYSEDPAVISRARNWIEQESRVVATGVLTGFPKTKKPQPSGGRGMRIVALELAPLNKAPQ